MKSSAIAQIISLSDVFISPLEDMCVPQRIYAFDCELIAFAATS